MSRIETTFATHSETTKLVAYVCALDPDLETSKKVCKCLIESGVDILELGVPFSDPLADGKTNQLAAERALEAGGTPDQVIDLVRDIRAYSEIPIVLYTYYNLVYSKGIDAYVSDAKDAGVDGILVLDLPPEEANEMVLYCKKYSMDHIFLIAPTTPESRIPKIVENASGFIYYVSREGVTGERADVASDIEQRVSMIKKYTDLPIAVGFGISNGQQVAQVAQHAEGVIVGSSIVKIVGKPDQTTEKMLESLESKISDLRTGLI
jgi:tryptophan synthase alpha chain